MNKTRRYLKISTFRLLLLYAIGATGQASTPQTTPTAPAGAPPANTAPCTPRKKGGLAGIFHPENNSIGRTACQKLGVCAVDQAINLPDSGKPCPANNPAPSVPPAPTGTPLPPVTAPESKPVLSEDGRFLYSCPKPSTKAAEYPVCKEPDGTFVPMMAIPLPPGSLNKGGPQTNGPGAVPAKPAVNTNQPSVSATPAPSQAPQTSGAQHN
jgi:hypothetical protein